MTREEAIDIIRCLAWHTRPDEEDIKQAIKELQDNSYELWKESYEVEHERNIRLEENIKALEQQTTSFEWCTDCKEYDQEKHCCPRYNKVIRNAIKEMKQEPKTGHWIEGKTDNPNIHNILCSCCFEGYPSKGHANSQYTKEKFQWCPNCGAKMIESQESEG